MRKNEVTIRKYVEEYFNGDNVPGEHHFVAVYLLNKINEIPDYVNPDGMKGSLSGDIGFKRGENLLFSIEVKLGKKNNKSSISFTASQYEKWFIKSEDKGIPNYLIVLIADSFFIINFPLFVEKYKGRYKSEIKEFKNRIVKKKNGPSFYKDCIRACCDQSSERFDLDNEDGISKRFQELNKEIEKLYE